MVSDPKLEWAIPKAIFRSKAGYIGAKRETLMVSKSLNSKGRKIGWYRELKSSM